MRKLMFLISTEGKSAEQVTKEAWAAFQKYQNAQFKKNIFQRVKAFLSYRKSDRP